MTELKWHIKAGKGISRVNIKFDSHSRLLSCKIIHKMQELNFSNSYLCRQAFHICSILTE